MGKGETSCGVEGGETVVIDQGERRSSCGYCKAPGRPSVSHGLWARSMTVSDYQELLDRGWRRSGSYLYKPEMKRTCCPSYTIRLMADKFVHSKDQLRVLKKLQRYLEGNHLNNTEHLMHSCSQNSSPSMEITQTVTQTSGNGQEDTYMDYLSAIIDDAVSMCKENGELPSTVELPRANVKKAKSQVKKFLANISGDLLYTSSISFQIFAVLQQSKTKNVNNNAIQSGEHLELTVYLVAEKLAASIDQLGALQDMSVKACKGHLNIFSSTRDIDSCRLPASSNIISPSSKDVTGTSKRRRPLDEDSTMALKKRRLEIRMKRSSFDPEEYELYRRYQVKVHDDKPEDITEGSYTNFLVDTPLEFCPAGSGKDVPSCGFGSFHQQYIVDDKLVAVGVVDILPKCLSSKYLFWDPDFAFLSLGKFAALKEIEWVRDAQTQCHSLQYYYLGYYIHSCSKMSYKAAYHPSELLCPLRYQWVPFCVVKPLLDRNSYVVLSNFLTSQSGASLPGELSNSSSSDTTPIDSSGKDDKKWDLDIEDETELHDENMFLIGDINNILIDLNGMRTKFKDLRQLVGPIKKKIMEMLKLQLHRYKTAVGADLAERMIYVLR